MGGALSKLSRFRGRRTVVCLIITPSCSPLIRRVRCLPSFKGVQGVVSSDNPAGARTNSRPRRKVGRFSSSLVFTTVTDRLQHLHMKGSEQYFSNTTDTLWLSGLHWTETSLAATPIGRIPRHRHRTWWATFTVITAVNVNHNSIKWRGECGLLHNNFLMRSCVGVSWESRESEKSRQQSERFTN